MPDEAHARHARGDDELDHMLFRLATIVAFPFLLRHLFRLRLLVHPRHRLQVLLGEAVVVVDIERVKLRHERLVVVLGDGSQRDEHSKHELGAIDAVAVLVKRCNQLHVQLPLQHLLLLRLPCASIERVEDGAGDHAKEHDRTNHVDDREATASLRSWRDVAKADRGRRHKGMVEAVRIVPSAFGAKAEDRSAAKVDHQEDDKGIVHVSHGVIGRRRLERALRFILGRRPPR